MAITDPTSSVYMNNMYVTGNNTVNNQNAAQNAAGTVDSSQAANFANILSNMMTMNTLSSLGDFSDNSNNSNGSGGFGDLFGMSALSNMSGLNSLNNLSGLNSNALLGMTGADSTGSSMLMALLFMLLASQNNNGQNNGLLNSLISNNAGNNSQNPSGNNFINNYNSGNTSTLCRHMLNNSVYGSSSIPSNSWIAANAALTNLPGQRSAAVYRSVIDQFDVENNSRYTVNKQGIGDTYCNIFTWDVTRAMGAEVPHFIETSTGRPVSEGGEGITELNANSVNDWLNTYGSSYGWAKVSPEEAQYYANMGMPAITSWKNSNGHGHLQVVSPSQDGTYNTARGVTIAQAGRQLKNYDYIDTVYGANSLANVEYFAHV